MIDGILADGIKVNVNFYDKEHENLLLAYPTSDQIQSIVDDGIVIPESEFLTYYLFHKKRPGNPGYTSYSELGKKIDLARMDLDSWLRFSDDSVEANPEAFPINREISERIGESIGLSVLNRIHGLTEADWGKLPEIAPNKSFDYEIASDGQNIIQIETKGSCVENNKIKESTVSKHKRSILEKKVSIRAAEKENNYKYPAELRYGTISVVGSSPSSTAQCWLLDPEPESINAPPSNLRIINRIKFLRDLISFISPRSQLASALSTRIADLQAISNPYELDNVDLKRGNGESFIFELPEMFRQSGSPFFQTRSADEFNETVGVVIKLTESELFYIGIRNELVVLSAKQNFIDILGYVIKPITHNRVVRCKISNARFKEMRLPEFISEIAVKTDNYTTFELEGRLHFGSEGLVFGVLPLDTKNRNENEFVLV